MRYALRNGLGLALLLVALALPAAQSKKTSEAELRASVKTLTEQIARLQRQQQNASEEKDRQLRGLRVAEQAVARAQGELGKVRTQRSERSAERARLAAEQAQREAERQRTQSDLALQLRSSYMMGRSEPFKMLLNQRNPAQFQRNLTYYAYFGRDRARKINLINENIAQIEELKRRIEEEDAQLAQLELERQRRAQEADQTRLERDRLVARLDADSKKRGGQLKRLQQERQQTERFLTDLRRRTETVPYDPNDPFAKLRGRLSWPVGGKLETRFGDRIGGKMTSDWIEIAADRGAEVRAVHEGRVIFADWLSGPGLLIILDHGGEYWTLYGHNEQIFKEVGATVHAGDVIATVGDSGGRHHPGLYFQLRYKKNAINPTGWFKSSAPPGG
jgi:septal ring factor EnvC (AmiA/AmiB activator)